LGIVLPDILNDLGSLTVVVSHLPTGDLNIWLVNPPVGHQEEERRSWLRGTLGKIVIEKSDGEEGEGYSARDELLMNNPYFTGDYTKHAKQIREELAGGPNFLRPTRPGVQAFWEKGD